MWKIDNRAIQLFSVIFSFLLEMANNYHNSLQNPKLCTQAIK